MNYRKLFSFIILITLLQITLSATQEVSIEKRSLIITDLHFTPFGSSELVKKLDDSPVSKWDTIFEKYASEVVASYGKEASPALLKSLTKGLKPYTEEAEFILFGGDILCHDFIETYKKLTGYKQKKYVRSFILKTVKYVVKHISEEFPDKAIYFTLGNNDSYRGDYLLKDGGSFLKDTSSVFFSNWIRNPGSRGVFMSDFSRHGYYSIRCSTNPGIRIISLNTIFFSANYPESNGDSAGETELKWFARELDKARIAGEKAWVIMHIPPGVNIYSTEKMSRSGELDVKLMWKQKFNKEYLKIVTKYADQIAVSFTGHTHMDDFRIVYKRKKPLDYVHISPAVSPVFGNNPAFQELVYDLTSGELKDFTTHYLNIQKKSTEWKKAYTFSEAYGMKLDIEKLSAGYLGMLPGTPFFSNYMKYYYVLSPSSIRNSWRWYVTGIGKLTVSDYKKSIEKRLK